MSIQVVRNEHARILVLNPNSSQSMTDGLNPVIKSVGLSPTTQVDTYTAPAASPASINNGEDIEASYEAVSDALFKQGLAVTGIFEASILTATALSSRGRGERWGIVTTGKFWEEHLSGGVAEYLGGAANSLGPDTTFAGVESTGLNASDFHHGVDPAVVTKKIQKATVRLLDKGVSCIVMGCAGMAGLEATIRGAASEKHGEQWAYETLHVVDGVREGLVQVDQMIKNFRLRRQPARQT
ncbi:hypothetical protein PG993_012673 [Apiospora rasikravindrae]|uniref:Hydantoin racemase n=1 Tax=Apiospora rasikravindrae TaxID=990691 RepID=A0ABR1S4E2_9PEZI